MMFRCDALRGVHPKQHGGREMARVKFDREFASEAEAREWMEKYKVDAWGYDPSFWIRQEGDRWLVSVTESASCD